MRKAEPRHTVAKLRRFIGLSQKEFADKVGRAVDTIRSIEQNRPAEGRPTGRLQLSEELAELIVDATGVDLDWLLANDVKRPMLNLNKAPYKMGDYEQAQLGQWVMKESPYIPFATFISSIGRIGDLLIKSYVDKRAPMCSYKLSQALDALEKEFGVRKTLSERISGYHPQVDIDSDPPLGKI